MATGYDWSGVEKVIAEAETGDALVGVGILGPDGSTFEHHGNRQFGAASTVKIPIMIEIFRQIERGERSLDDPYELKDEDRTPGAGGVMFDLHTGMTFTLNDLIYLMISISDNTATNLLIRMAGMETVTKTMHALGMTNSRLVREMKGRAAQGDEPENWAAPLDYVTVVKAILDGRAASRESCDAMIAMLQKQHNRRRIARYIPVSNDVLWGSKTGTVKGATNDAGFITGPGGTMIIAVFCENFPDVHSAEQTIGYVSRAAMTATGVVEPLYTS